MARSKDVDRYIEAAPLKVRSKLREVRSAIRSAAPDAVERLSYGMPFYSFNAESGFQARICYFGFLGERIVFYTRPAFLEKFRREVDPYLSSKSALHFPPDRPVPLALIKNLVGNAVRKHRPVGSAPSRK